MVGIRVGSLGFCPTVNEDTPLACDGVAAHLESRTMPVPDVTLDDAWTALTADPDAILIDVRTTAEWTFVGVPNLSTIGKEVRTVSWSFWPGGSSNDSFVAEAAADVAPDQAIYLLCRSGARSKAAGMALEAAGFTATFNVMPGFEGDLGPDNHRHGGWKDTLPWQQS